MFQAAACRSTAAPATDSCTPRTTGQSGYGARSFGAPWRRSNAEQLGRPGENLSSQIQPQTDASDKDRFAIIQ